MALALIKLLPKSFGHPEALSTPFATFFFSGYALCIKLLFQQHLVSVAVQPPQLPLPHLKDLKYSKMLLPLLSAFSSTWCLSIMKT